MARPRVYEEKRVTTAIRLPETLHDQLKITAHERDVSVNYLVQRAVEGYLARLTSPETVSIG